MVEVARLELAASWSLTKRATKLRYTSWIAKILYYTAENMSRVLRQAVGKIPRGHRIKKPTLKNAHSGGIRRYSFLLSKNARKTANFVARKKSNFRIFSRSFSLPSIYFLSRQKPSNFDIRFHCASVFKAVYYTRKINKKETNRNENTNYVGWWQRRTAR